MNATTKNKKLFSFDSAFLLVLFVIGMITTFSYGVYWDQMTEQTILFSNLKEYAIHFGLTDNEWMQALNEQGIQRISESVEKDHGIAMYYPAGIVWYLNLLSPSVGNLFWHMYTFLLVFMGVCFLYFLCLHLFRSRKISAVTTLLFFLTPRMFASSHYNNKDMVFVSLVFALFYWGWRLIQATTWKNTVLFAIFGALAFNVKIIGAYYFCFIGIYAIFALLFSKKFNKNILLKCAVCIITWLAMFLLITPAAWSGLISYIEYVLGFTLNFSRWNNHILYNGQLIHNSYTGMPHKYLLTMMIYTIPVVIQILMVLGGGILIYELIRKKLSLLYKEEGYIAFVTFLGAVPVLYATISATSIYNGWRHFYFVYCSIIILCGYGIYKLNHLISGGFVNRIKKIVCVGYLAISSLFLMLNYPLADSYYNILAGKNVELRYEMDYWNVSMKQALQAILADTSEETVSVCGINSYTSYGLETNMISLSAKENQRIHLMPVEEWTNADYVVVNVTYAMIYTAKEYELLQKEYQKVTSLNCYNNIVAEVYKKN